MLGRLADCTSIGEPIPDWLADLTSWANWGVEFVLTGGAAGGNPGGIPGGIPGGMPGDNDGERLERPRLGTIAPAWIGLTKKVDID